MPRLRHLVLASAVALVAFALLPASAFAGAAEIYASPTGSGSDCVEKPATPCTLEEARKMAVAEDAVILEPGTYVLLSNGFSIGKEIEFGGRSGAAASTVIQTTSVGLYESGLMGPLVHDLTIEGPGGLLLSSGTAERVFVSYVGTSSGCSLSKGVTMRDSVCWAHGPKATSRALDANDPLPTGTVTLRNVTAFSSGAAGTALYAEATSSGKLTVDASNVVARSETGSDVVAILNGGGTSVAVNLSHSSYEKVQQSPPATTVTPTGSNGNQVAPPVFVDAVNGDFHEALSSPTLDAGVVGSPAELETASKNNPLRLDPYGQPRVQAKCLGGVALIDIGAFEAAPVDCTPPPHMPPPDNKFRFGKQKLNKRNGTGTLVAIIPGPGTLKLAGKGLRSAAWTAKAASSVKLPVVTFGMTKKSLAKTGKRKVSATVTFTPTGGSPSSQARSLVLHRKLP